MLCRDSNLLKQRTPPLFPSTDTLNFHNEQPTKESLCRKLSREKLLSFGSLYGSVKSRTITGVHYAPELPAIGRVCLKGCLMWGKGIKKWKGAVHLPWTYKMYTHKDWDHLVLSYWARQMCQFTPGAGALNMLKLKSYYVVILNSRYVNATNSPRNLGASLLVLHD